MEEPIVYILQRKKGFPLPSQFKNTYRQMEMEEASTQINKEIIIVYKYPKPLFGNYGKEFLHKGFLITPKSENHIWLHAHPYKKEIFLTKKRFSSELEAYIMKQEKDIVQ